MSATGTAPARMPVRWSLADGTCELLKWLAFAAMLVDHVDVLFFHRGEPVLSAIGRIAMPIFALVFGYNLSRSRDPDRVLSRLFFAGLAVQPIAMATINQGHAMPLNILLAFAADGLSAQAFMQGRSVVAGVLFVLGSLVMDYGPIASGLVMVGWLYFASRERFFLVGLAILVAGLCWLNGNAWALLGVALFVGAGWVQLRFPRTGTALLVAYPGHLLVLGAAAAAM